MVNVAHATLTGAELHEPKGVSTAALGTVYVANGAGSGSWNSVATSAFTGMIADFAAPVAPTGWLELDGSVISTATYSGLFAVMSITSSGTRSSGNATVTGIPSTTGFKAGYYIFGTGISAGTTILTVDSAVQVTLSGPAGSSGTSAFFVSPWPMNTGTVTLPDLTTAGRFRRSRSSATTVGQVQASQNLSHNHTGTITTSTHSADHTHTFSGSTGTQSANHTHSATAGVQSGVASDITPGSVLGVSNTTITTGTESTNHTHGYSGTTSGVSVNHTHTVTIPSDGSAEARPIAIVVLTCIKT